MWGGGGGGGGWSAASGTRLTHGWCNQKAVSLVKKFLILVYVVCLDSHEQTYKFWCS